MPVTVNHKEVNSGTQQPRKAVIWTAPRIVQTPSSKENQLSTRKEQSYREFLPFPSLPFGADSGILES